MIYRMINRTYFYIMTIFKVTYGGAGTGNLIMYNVHVCI